MHVCFLQPYYDREAEPPPAFLDRTVLLRALPEAFAARGHTVNVVVLYASAHRFDAGGVRYHFVPPGPLTRALARMAAAPLRRPPALLTPAVGVLRTAFALRPDVVHVHGTQHHLNLALLRRLRRPGGPPLVLHYHGGFPSPLRLLRRVQRRNLEAAARLCFTTSTLAEPFVAAGVLPGLDRVVALTETSALFHPRPREAARRATGLTGRPVLLWTGRLDPIKDPLTVLRGFEIVLRTWPAAQLYLYYRDAPLLPELRAFVAARPGLHAHVHFQGTAPHPAMEDLYNSADYLVQASRREFSGYAVLEAMACGVPPVVTDIPAFRALTADGRHGCLFPPGDPTAFARTLLALPPERTDTQARAIRDHFDAHLSFPAMARRLEAVYEAVLKERKGIDNGEWMMDNG